MNQKRLEPDVIRTFVWITVFIVLILLFGSGPLFPSSQNHPWQIGNGSW